MRIPAILVGIGLLLGLASPAGAARPPKMHLRELALMTRASKDMAAMNRRVRFAVPAGWTGDRHPNGRSMELFGPGGEGRMLVVAALHPSELHGHLASLKARHPSAAPSPPQHLTIPGINPELGERATRFVITGREVGEMVMIEKQNTIVLFVTVVDPNAWPAVQEEMRRAYPTLQVVDLPVPAKSP